MSYKYVCARCGLTKFNQTNIPREHCSKCVKIIDQLKDRLPTHEPIKPRLWSQMAPHEIKQDLAFMVRCFSDLGASGPVTCFRPGQPMFEQVAGECTDIKRIHK